MALFSIRPIILFYELLCNYTQNVKKLKKIILPHPYFATTSTKKQDFLGLSENAINGSK